MNRSSTPNNMMDTPHYDEDLNYGRSTQNNRGYNQLTQNDNQINSNLINSGTRQQEQPGFFKRWVINPIVYLGSFFCSRRGDTPSDEENRIFSELPERITNLNSFNTLTKTRVGILVLYQNTDLEYYTNLVNEIKREEHTYDILVNIYNFRK